MGFWSKFGKIASIAAPIAAAPFTGGATLALIGAGAGAGGAALNHQGLKGILGGAALGAIPGVGKAATAGKLGGTAAKIAAGAGKAGILGTAGNAGKVGTAINAGQKILGSMQGGQQPVGTPPFVAPGGGGGQPGTGMMDRIVGTANKMAPILAGASKSAQAANQFRDTSGIAAEGVKQGRDRLAAELPGMRMANSTRASMISHASPTEIKWGGPGSGERGEVPQFSGGYTGGLQNLDPQTKQLADSVMKEELLKQLKGGDSEMPYMKDFGKESASDKALGGGALAASVLGGAADWTGLLKHKQPQPGSPEMPYVQGEEPPDDEDFPYGG